MGPSSLTRDQTWVPALELGVLVPGPAEGKALKTAFLNCDFAKFMCGDHHHCTS